MKTDLRLVVIESTKYWRDIIHKTGKIFEVYLTDFNNLSDSEYKCYYVTFFTEKSIDDETEEIVRKNISLYNPYGVDYFQEFVAVIPEKEFNFKYKGKFNQDTQEYTSKKYERKIQEILESYLGNPPYNEFMGIFPI